MKNTVFLIIVLLVIPLTIGGIMSFNFQKTDIQSETAVLNYCYNGKEVYIELSLDESLKLKNIINNKKLYSDNLSCGFTKEISISFDEQTFCIACDSCPILKVGGEDKYLKISELDRKQIEKMFIKYGCTFPCI